MDYKELYELWLTNPYFDEDTRKELEAIKDDNKEIEQKLEQLGKWIDAYYLYSDEIDGDALVDGIYSGYAQAL